MNAKIGFKLQVTATSGYYSVYDRGCRMMWLFSDAPDDLEDETVMEMHGAKALYSAVKRLMNSILTEDKEA
jgi:hypothetical protein